MSLFNGISAISQTGINYLDNYFIHYRDLPNCIHDANISFADIRSYHSKCQYASQINTDLSVQSQVNNVHSANYCTKLCVLNVLTPPSEYRKAAIQASLSLSYNEGHSKEPYINVISNVFLAELSVYAIHALSAFCVNTKLFVQSPLEIITSDSIFSNSILNCLSTRHSSGMIFGISSGFCTRESFDLREHIPRLSENTIDIDPSHLHESTHFHYYLDLFSPNAMKFTEDSSLVGPYQPLVHAHGISFIASHPLYFVLLDLTAKCYFICCQAVVHYAPFLTALQSILNNIGLNAIQGTISDIFEQLASHTEPRVLSLLQDWFTNFKYYVPTPAFDLAKGLLHHFTIDSSIFLTRSISEVFNHKSFRMIIKLYSRFYESILPEKYSLIPQECSKLKRQFFLEHIRSVILHHCSERLISSSIVGLPTSEALHMIRNAKFQLNPDTLYDTMISKDLIYVMILYLTCHFEDAKDSLKNICSIPSFKEANPRCHLSIGFITNPSTSAVTKYHKIRAWQAFLVNLKKTFLKST